MLNFSHVHIESITTVLSWHEAPIGAILLLVHQEEQTIGLCSTLQSDKIFIPLVGPHKGELLGQPTLSDRPAIEITDLVTIGIANMHPQKTDHPPVGKVIEATDGDSRNRAFLMSLSPEAGERYLRLTSSHGCPRGSLVAARLPIVTLGDISLTPTQA